MTALVVPRPIALVTSMSEDGVTNAAPYSFFNVFSHHPALVVLGIERKSTMVQKDTGRNIEVGNEFVVNLVNEEIAVGMNDCAIDFPAETSEVDMAGFTLAASTKVRPARIAEAPAALECRRYVTLQPGHGRELVIGEILAVHIRDGIVDPVTLRMDFDKYRPIGRLFANLYCRTRDTFELVRRTYADWQRDQGRQ